MMILLGNPARPKEIAAGHPSGPLDGASWNGNSGSKVMMAKTISAIA